MKTTCNVTNKSSGRVVYRIPEDNIRRVYFPKEEKKNVPVDELTRLVQQPGGMELFYNFLYVDDPEVVSYLINGEAAPEYWFTEENLPNWMKTCSLPEFQDALDFAPEGTKDLIKKFAVSLPLNDSAKREAIKTQLGFNVDLAIENGKEDKPAEKPAGRRVEASSVEATPQRRVVVGNK